MTIVEVFVDRGGVPLLVGQAFFTRQRGRLSTTFLYDVGCDGLGGHGLGPAAGGWNQSSAASADASGGAQCAHSAQVRSHGPRAQSRLHQRHDVNPTPDLWRARATSIMGAEALPDEAEALLALAGECSLSLEQAHSRIERIANAFTKWQAAARRNRIGEQEITMVAESIRPRLEAVDATGRR